MCTYAQAVKAISSHQPPSLILERAGHRSSTRFQMPSLSDNPLVISSSFVQKFGVRFVTAIWVTCLMTGPNQLVNVIV